jgi:putative membrane protein
MRRGTALALSTIAGAAAAVSVEGVAFAADGRGFAGGFGPHRRGGAFLMLLLLAAVVVLAVLLWHGRRPAPAAPAAPFVSAPPASPVNNAHAILADRLARGEISPDEYRASVAVLRETSPPS